MVTTMVQFYRTVRQHDVYLAFSMHQLKSNLKSGANGRVESQHTHTHKPRVKSSHDDDDDERDGGWRSGG